MELVSLVVIKKNVDYFTFWRVIFFSEFFNGFLGRFSAMVYLVQSISWISLVINGKIIKLIDTNGPTSLTEQRVNECQFSHELSSCELKLG